MFLIINNKVNSFDIIEKMKLETYKDLVNCTPLS